MAQQFASQHDVILICPGSRTALYEEENGLQVFGVKSAGQGHVCVPALSQRNVNAVFGLLDEFKPDVVHAHEPVAVALIGQVWAKTHNVPFVHTAHVLPSEVFRFGMADVPRVLKSPLAGSVAKRFFLNSYENCHAIIALNCSAADDLARFGYRGRAFRIPNGRDLKWYGVCRRADISLPEKVVTFMGFVC